METEKGSKIHTPTDTESASQSISLPAPKHPESRSRQAEQTFADDRLSQQALSYFPHLLTIPLHTSIHKQAITSSPTQMPFSGIASQLTSQPSQSGSRSRASG